MQLSEHFRRFVGFKKRDPFRFFYNQMRTSLLAGLVGMAVAHGYYPYYFPVPYFMPFAPYAPYASSLSPVGTDVSSDDNIIYGMANAVDGYGNEVRGYKNKVTGNGNSLNGVINTVDGD